MTKLIRHGTDNDETHDREAKASGEITIPTERLASAERGLKAAAVITSAFGLLFAVGSTGATDWPVRLFTDIGFLRVGDGSASLSDSHHLVDAIMGGVMFGWGVMIWLLVDRFLRRSPGDVRHVITVALTSWFVVDSAGSIASGAWFNAVMNVGFAALFVLPLRKL